MSIFARQSAKDDKFIAWENLHGGDQVNWYKSVIEIKNDDELEELLVFITNEASGHWSYKYIEDYIDPHTTEAPVDVAEKYVFAFQNTIDTSILDEYMENRG